jgi:NhaP-type Na+/H+ or K+/H+ antiporter
MAATRLPFITPAVIWLAVGMLIGPLGIKLLMPGLQEDGHLIGAITETALLVSLFCVGLRLRAPLQWRYWRTPMRLGTLTMLATVLLIAGLAHSFFNLTFAEALLLGAILAPTDPVLVSNVPLHSAEDHEEARSILTAEGAINRGLAMPIMAFALGAAGLADARSGFAWLGIEVVWAIGGGAVLGWLIGAAALQGLARLDVDRQSDLFLDELLVLAAGAIAYGVARVLGANGFVAVLAAGLALCHGARIKPAVAIRKLKPRLLAVTQRVERVASAVVVMLLGVMVAAAEPRAEMFAFALVLLIAIRPLAVYLGLGPTGRESLQERRLLGWFGMRGAASLFYLVAALNDGLPAELAHELTAITLVTLATSIVLHGLSATPLVSRPVDRLG